MAKYSKNWHLFTERGVVQGYPSPLGGQDVRRIQLALLRHGVLIGRKMNSDENTDENPEKMQICVCERVANLHGLLGFVLSAGSIVVDEFLLELRVEPKVLPAKKECRKEEETGVRIGGYIQNAHLEE